MNALVPLSPPSSPALPVLVAAAGDRAGVRFLEFFAAQIRNPHTRRAYARTVGEFLSWCESIGVASLPAIQPLHVASWIEMQGREVSAPSVKQQLGVDPTLTLVANSKCRWQPWHSRQILVMRLAGDAHKIEACHSDHKRLSAFRTTMLTGGATSIRSFVLFRNPSAPVSVSISRPTFLIVGAANSPRDIVIVRLEQKKDHRELQIGRFNGYTGGGMEYRKEDITEVGAKADSSALLVTPKSDLRPGEYIIFASSPTPFPAGYGGCDLEVK